MFRRHGVHTPYTQYLHQTQVTSGTHALHFYYQKWPNAATAQLAVLDKTGREHVPPGQMCWIASSAQLSQLQYITRLSFALALALLQYQCGPTSARWMACVIFLLVTAIQLEP